MKSFENFSTLIGRIFPPATGKLGYACYAILEVPGICDLKKYDIH